MYKVKIVFWLILLFQFFLIQKGNSQTVFPYEISIKLHGGLVIPHRSILTELVQKKVKGFEIDILRNPDNEKKWSHFFNFPKYGLGLMYLDLGNRQQLGYAMGVFPYMDFSILKKTKFSINYRFGVGLGYISKPFDMKTNFKNFFNSTHLNAFVTMRLDSKFRLTERTTALFGVNMSHLSNGGSRLPNLGINIPTLSLGLSYGIGKSIVQKKDTSVTLPLFFNAYVIGDIGWGQVNPIGSKAFFASDISIVFDKYLNTRNSWLFGADGFYNNSYPAELSHDSIIASNSFSNKTEYGLFMGYSINFSNLSFVINMGGYFKSPLHRASIFYHKLGLRYKITDNIIANLTLKTHWAKAQYIQMGVGYRLFSKKYKKN